MIAIAKAIGERVLQIALVALFVTIGTSALVRLVPGDPARAILGERASEESLAALTAQLGLDRPIHEQVLNSLAGLLQGDLGTSFANRGQDVLGLILPALATTASVAVVALTFSLIGGTAVGLLLALVKRPEADLAGRLVLTVILALPGFMAGLILLYLVSLQLHLAPAGGWAGSWPENARFVWLPSLALAIGLGAVIARSVRQAALDTIGQPFVQAARTRGVPRLKIVLSHVLPNSLLPVIPLIGINAGILVSGTVTVEVIFTLPGLGIRLLEAMGTRDLPVVQGIALVTAVSIVFFNLVADLVNIAADPRLRRSH